VAYREDNDLEFLQYASRENLDVLIEYLTKDEDGNPRLTEEITFSSEYKEHNPNHEMYWELIASEIQCFGGNTIATIFRGGKGVLYKEVLTDVCNKVDVKYLKTDSIDVIEMYLLEKILIESMEQLSFKEKQNLVKELGLKITDFSKQAMTIALQSAIKIGGFASYKMALIVANSVMKMLLGRGLSFVANATLTRVMGVMTGPVGWAITGVWTVVDIAGPAYRVTIPSVIQIAFIRAKLKHEKKELF
jgi:uncharacterized protein YaaW (UPF0174 family)